MRANLRPIEQKASQSLRVLSYNVLAQSLIRREFYPTNGNALKWVQRFPAFSEEMVAYDPDIVFLQEVDAAKIDSWKSLLASEPLNMESHFFRGQNKNHGIVVAFKRDKFHHVAHKHPHYDAVSGPPKQQFTRSTGVAMVVECSDGTRLVLGTTHLYWHPHADYERLRQLCVFLGAASILKQEYEAKAVVLGGDFNSTTDSPVYEVLKTGRISAEASEALLESAKATHFGPFNARPGEGNPSTLDDPVAAVRELQEAWDGLQVPHLTSCYAKLTGEPSFTNWTEGFKETIDYILVSDEVTPKYVLPLPQAADLGPEPNSLPRARNGFGYPSDHLALVADIEVSPSPAN